MNDLKLHFDKYGVLCQIQPDGSLECGDGLNWVGHYTYLINNGFHKMDFFNVAPGAYVRHPIPLQTNNGFGAYYGSPWDSIISRDQLTGLLASKIAGKRFYDCFLIFLHAGCWLWLFSYNTRKNGVSHNSTEYKIPDVTLFDIWSMYLRGMLGWLSAPINMVFDIHLLLAVVYYNYVDKKDPISFNIKVLTAREFYPTLISVLAFALLDKDKAKREYRSYWTGKRDMKTMADIFDARIRKIRNPNRLVFLLFQGIALAVLLHIFHVL